MVYLFFYVHWQACLWHIACSWDQYERYEFFDDDLIDRTNAQRLENWYRGEWIMPTSWLAYWDTKLNQNDYPTIMKYIYNLYYSVLFMGLNEIGPNTDSHWQLFGSFFLLFMSNFINSFFLSEFVNIAFKILQSGMDR